MCATDPGTSVQARLGLSSPTSMSSKSYSLLVTGSGSAMLQNIADNNIVRVAASFDMGWFTRGTGRTYDRLSGKAAIIGCFSKKVLCYVTLNRKCAKCNYGHSPEDHDCRLNFVGSAKAMEPHAAILLTKDNPILNACHLEVGIFIANNDSNSVCAVKEANDQEVVNQSNKNHTANGVVNELYKIKKTYKKLIGTAIQYLKKSFITASPKIKGMFSI